jgi:membrane-bound ClpP family serine protease
VARIGRELTPRRANTQIPPGSDVNQGGNRVLILGLILLLIGWLTGIGILTTLGIILLVIGAVLWTRGSTGRPVGGRRYWY